PARRRPAHAVRRSLCAGVRAAACPGPRHTNGGLSHAAPDHAGIAVEPAEYARRHRLRAALAGGSATAGRAPGCELYPRPGVSLSYSARFRRDHLRTGDHLRDAHHAWPARAREPPLAPVRGARAFLSANLRVAARAAWLRRQSTRNRGRGVRGARGVRMSDGVVIREVRDPDDPAIAGFGRMQRAAYYAPETLIPAQYIPTMLERDTGTRRNFLVVAEIAGRVVGGTLFHWLAEAGS